MSSESYPPQEVYRKRSQAHDVEELCLKYCGAWVQTQGLVRAKQSPNHWAALPALDQVMLNKIGSAVLPTAASSVQWESHPAETSHQLPVYTSSPPTNTHAALWPDSVICTQVSRRLWWAAWTNRPGNLLMRTFAWPAGGPHSSWNPAIWIPAQQGKGCVATTANHEHMLSWVHLSMGNTGTLIVTPCFENQLASVQTSSQIHLNLIESRALKF